MNSKKNATSVEKNKEEWKRAIGHLIAKTGEMLKITVPTPVCYELMCWNKEWNDYVLSGKADIFCYAFYGISNSMLRQAPRGILYHMVQTNDQGLVSDYDVIVPTSQNQINIENDLKKYFNENIDKTEEELKLNAEKIIRAYDPCMSCATNFLKIEWTNK